MGQLVFQAALGGAVNLIGPNISATTNFTLPGADGTNGQALTTNGSGVLGFSSIVSGAAGSNTQVQFNSGGNFGASASLTWDGTNLTSTGFSGPHNGTVGATTANTGNFTTLTTSSTVTLNGGTANGVTYLNGSKVLTSGSALTFDGTNGGTSGLWSVGNLASVSGGYVRVNRADNATYNEIKYATGDLFYLNQANGGAYQFNISGSETMRLTSTSLYTASGINVGIGTSSPSVKLDVNGVVQSNVSSGNGIVKAVGQNIGLLQIQSSTGSTYAQMSGFSGTLQLNVSTSSMPSGNGGQFVLDASGNIGVGVTPSAWSSGGNMQLSTLTLAGNDYSIGSNYYQAAGNYKYVAAASTPSARLSFYGGAFTFLQAGAGTAGNNISSTTAMVLDASGNLGVGTTSPIRKLDVQGSGSVYASITNTTSGSGSARVQLFNNGDTSDGFSIINNSGASGVVNLLNYKNSDMAFWTNFTERARIDSSGNFCYGVQSFSAASNGFLVSANGASTYTAHANGTSSGATYSYFYYNNSAIGSITQNGTTAVAYNTSSDYRLKNTITPMTGALAKVALLKPCTYKWNADGSDGEGFIAHELAEVCPHAVTGKKDAVDEDGNPKYQGIDTSFLVATVVAALQELKAEFDAYKASHP